jgi:hypothetical protein
MIRVIVVLALAWIALMPPFFTNGACTAEFEQESTRLEAESKSIISPQVAAAYWNARQVPYSTISAQECRRAKPSYVYECSSGPLIYVKVPVKNKICRIYRDDEIRIQLQYDAQQRLERIVTDMNPFKSLVLPGTRLAVHWAR